VLGPMVYRGASAVCFDGTVEFRKMQRDLFRRGDLAALEAEIAETDSFRKEVYERIDAFKSGIDVEALSEQVRRIHRDLGEELRFKGVPTEQYTEIRELSRDIRSTLERCFQSQDVNAIRADVASVMTHRDDPRFKGTAAERYFKLAENFLKAAESTDLTKYHEYAGALHEVEAILFHSDSRPGLLGPRPGEPTPLLAMLSYGATRWDQASQLLHKLEYYEVWEQVEPNQPRVRTEKLRAELFPESFRPLFSYVEDNARQMLRPRFTFYWQYFIDDNLNTSHYFGGVGPEILGTLLITVLGMLFVVPLGVISAAYIVECAADNQAMRVIRMCINTLAGVPSIVFGLFGLAFFVTFLFPLLGFEPKPCILAASMTLAVLTLPVMIRASEEAIRTVPRSYKEGSLALGASGFRTFIAVTLPAALPGILTGVILSLSRIAGETAPILFTGAVALGPVPKSMFEPTRTLSYGSWDMAVGDVMASMVPHNQYGMVVTLIMLILILNAMAIGLRSRVFKKLKGL
jgi:phosphate transport system permease protein